jgi:repressor LexA
MTPRQKQCLDVISEYWQANDHAPSFREIMNTMQVKSLASVSAYVDALERRGYVERLAHKSRSLRVVRTGQTSP